MYYSTWDNVIFMVTFFFSVLNLKHILLLLFPLQHNHSLTVSQTYTHTRGLCYSVQRLLRVISLYLLKIFCCNFLSVHRIIILIRNHTPVPRSCMMFLLIYCFPFLQDVNSSNAHWRKTWSSNIIWIFFLEMCPHLCLFALITFSIINHHHHVPDR